MRALLLVAALTASACKRRESPPAPPPGSASAAPVAIADAGAPPVDAEPVPEYRTASSDYDVDPDVAGTSKSYMVVAEGPDAAKAGRDVLAAGGNAVDAAVATAFALAVVHPSAGNLGGGGFAVVRTGPGKITTLDFRETAPAASTADMFLGPDGKPTRDSVVGHRAAGVPGSVAGLYELHAKYGKRPWKELVAPAIAFARNGFTLIDEQATTLVRAQKSLEKFPASAALWLRDGKTLPAGTVVKIPELAATLERIAAKGPAGFYQGETAQLIVDEMKRGGGIITLADLAGYKAVWREPLRFTYRGHRVASMPPPSSGGIVLALTANILERVDLKQLGWHSAEHVHWVVESWRRGFAVRNEWLGDPAFVKNPVDKLLSRKYADELAKTITDRASSSRDVPGLVEGTNTTNFVVVDKTGMAVALTTTLNTSFGSGVTVTGAGFLLNNEMDDFAVKPGSANVFGLVQGTANKIEPGKRMLSSMAPTIVEDAKGQLVMVLGGRGGPRIITAVWQTLSNVLDFGMPADAAIAAPRFHHQHLPEDVRIERESIDQAADAKLESLGYPTVWGDRFFACANVILRTAEGWSGAADPRGGGAALGD